MQAWIEIWTRWKIGVLPFEGSLTDQPAKVVDLMERLDGLEAQRQLKESKEAESKAKVRSRAGGSGG